MIRLAGPQPDARLVTRRRRLSRHVDTEVDPELEHFEERFVNRGIVEIQIGLM